MGGAVDQDLIRAEILARALERGAGKSFCPSEVARALSADWRPLMGEVRRVAAMMQDEGVIRATQRGVAVRADTVRGPIRLSLATGQERAPT